MIPDEKQDSGSKSSVSESSPGKLLAAARERMGFSQDQVAGELYMTLSKVRALENDEFAKLHSDTFIRGYLRAYANLVKIDVNEVMAAYDKQAQRLGLVEVFVPKAAEGNSKKTWLLVIFIGVVLVVLWLISVWFFDNKKEPDYPLPAALIVPQETISVPVVASSSSVSDEMIVEPQDPSAAPAGDVAQVGEELSVQTAAIDVIQNAQSSSLGQAASSLSNQNAEENPDELVFVFTEECWLEVSDAQGDVLATQLESAGSMVTVKGLAPFEVKLGNVQGVSITLNGKPVTFTPARGTNVRVLKIGQ
jgi:cytoskeleton protein RodZ